MYICFDLRRNHADLRRYHAAYIRHGAPHSQPNRKQDNSDGQYAGFRDRIPVLFAAMLGYLLLSWLLRVAVDDRSPMQQSSPLMSKLSHGHATRSASALYTASRNGESARAWPAFMLLFSMVFLTVLHGYGIIKIVGLLSAHYALTMMISRVAGGRWMPIAAWGFCIALLFLNDLYKGYAFKNVSPALGFLVGEGVHYNLS